ncbi:TetR/AcrR family transcriptional regulator [Paenibacillus marinisediminis]
MFEKFHSIDAEKQARILNAAMNEFARNGYANASTNEIVKAAGISKGLLFHYFDNKKQLFLYIYDYCLDISMKELYEQIDFEETDLFAKIRQIQNIKLEIVLRHPEFFRFVETAYTDQSSDIKDDIDQRNTDLLASSMSRLFANIDHSKFKDNLDIPKTINIILWSLEGYGQQLMKTAKLTGQELDYVAAAHEFDHYIEILKNGFYK